MAKEKMDMKRERRKGRHGGDEGERQRRYSTERE